jgi:hypothetical protein
LTWAAGGGWRGAGCGANFCYWGEKYTDKNSFSPQSDAIGAGTGLAEAKSWPLEAGQAGQAEVGPETQARPWLRRQDVVAPLVRLGGPAVGSTPVGITPVGITPLGITPLGITPVGSTPVGRSVRGGPATDGAVVYVAAGDGTRRGHTDGRRTRGSGAGGAR